MNPPYLHAPRHRAAAHAGKRAADFEEDEGVLDRWVQAARGALKPGGSLSLIHRADRLADVLSALSGFGGILIFPLWPKPGRAAKRVIVRAAKGSKQPAALAPGLVLHQAEGGYTPATEAVLRDAQPLLLMERQDR
jgi:tRNA1(Val) A37 N6-methylase TrmN6